MFILQDLKLREWSTDLVNFHGLNSKQRRLILPERLHHSNLMFELVRLSMHNTAVLISREFPFVTIILLKTVLIFQVNAEDEQVAAQALDEVCLFINLF